MGKAQRRARKKQRRALLRATCEQCGLVIRGETHDTPWSRTNVTWDGVAIVAWCPRCGWEYAS